MLTRLTSENGKFEELKDEWKKQCDEYGESFDDYATPAIQHAEKIASENPPDATYGIYAGVVGDEYQCLMHINQAALPKTTGKTLRILWVLLTPKYDFVDVKHQDLARLSAEIIVDAVNLASSDLKSDHIKIHLGNFADHRFFGAIASGLQAIKFFNEQAIRGNWMHITL